jgi:hypothetical protein
MRYGPGRKKGISGFYFKLLFSYLKKIFSFYNGKKLVLVG